MTTPDPFNLTGRTIGKYQIGKKLGHGGMAQVYEAYQPGLDRYVAVKILHPHLTGDEDFDARFEREARAIAALEHPHIVRVYDFDTRDGLTFLVMERLHGQDLKRQLQALDCEARLMPLTEIAALMADLGQALDYAHAKGVVHRDIKPSNILITDAGRVVLTDFGIARMIEATALTDSSGPLGTPAYMSPEQGRGEPADARSDIYALGVLLYQLCTGQVPFDADTPYAIILKHITAPLTPPRALRPELPQTVEAVILKALAKDPQDRFQTAGALARALDVAAQAPEAAAPEAAPPAAAQAAPPRVSLWRRFWWVPVVAVILAGLVWALLDGGATGPLPAPSPTAAPLATPVKDAQAVSRLDIADPARIDDTWLNPDLPEGTWADLDLVHLQGPLTPDRTLVRFDLAGIPEDAEIVSATLTLRAELWGDEVFPGAVVVYTVLTPWDPTTATYQTPWTAPGLAAGVDYDSTPLDIRPIAETGPLVFNVTKALHAWIEERRPNQGFVIMMSEDSHNMAHWWLYLSEQPEAAARPTLRVSYRSHE